MSLIIDIYDLKCKPLTFYLRSETFNIPLLFIRFDNDTALRLFSLVHAAGPGFLAFVAKSVQLILAVMVSLDDGLTPDGFLHIRAESELGIGGNGCRLLNLVDFSRHNCIDCLVCTSRELVSSLSIQSCP